MCDDSKIPLFEKKRLEMKLLALQALTKQRSPSPNDSVVSHRSQRSQRSQSRQRKGDHETRRSSRSRRNDEYTTRGHDVTDDGFPMPRHSRTPTIVRIVFSEQEEQKLNELDAKLVSIKHKIDQIMQNMSSLNWERDRLEKRIDEQFDEFVIHLQRRREDIKHDLNEIAAKQMQMMKGHIQTLNKQTKQIRDSQKKCEKYLSGLLRITK